MLQHKTLNGTGRQLANIALITDIGAEVQGNTDPQRYAWLYMQAFSSNDTRSIIANVDTTAAILKTGSVFFPVTINDEEYENSYVCSPYTACVSYAKEEMEKLENKPLELILSSISSCLSVLLKKAKINKVVCVNNWMLSTNLYAPWDGSDIAKIRDFFTDSFPDHALMFRSLNKHTDAELLKQFKDNGFMTVPSRQVYIFDRTLSPYMERHNTQIDFKSLDKTDYKVVRHDELLPSDYPRIVELYNLLYLDKYSKHNPQFTESCITHWHQKKLLTMIGLRNKEGVLDGIIGFFEQNNVTSAPLVGYDTNLSKKLALYRLLMITALSRANDNNFVLNLSSGAADFKRLRGGVPFIEYSAVHISHLPWYKRFVWKLTNVLLSTLGVPIMKAFKL